MDRTATKEAAEALLRELPSVVGAYVLEDVFGHPREIHVLISAGPSARHFARDVRDMLEERLGVPIDQRVISIAQLAGEGEAGEDASATEPADTHGGPPGVPTAQAAAADSAIAGGMAEPGSTAAPIGEEAAGPLAGSAAPVRRALAEPPRLLLDGTSLERREGRIGVRVRLRHAGELYEGHDTQMDTPQARLRAGARALLDGATHAARGGGRFLLEDAAVVRAIGRDYVLLTVLVQATRLGRRPLVLAGAHPLDEEIEVTAALAALKAINRVFTRLSNPDSP